MLVGAATRIESYEIAAYESALSIADELGEEQVVALLEKSLSEENATKLKLFNISEEKLMNDATSELDPDSTTDGKTLKSNHSAKGSMASAGSSLFIVFGLCSIIFMHGAIGCVDRDGGLKADGTITAQGKLDKARASQKVATADEYQPDNSGRNVTDSNKGQKTADSQDMFGDETEILANIRRKIVSNDTLSTYGKNVKVIIEDGSVYLRGPVTTSNEKDWIEKTTIALAGDLKVNNQLEIKP
jgi:hyperosmotically inducible protein